MITVPLVSQLFDNGKISNDQTLNYTDKSFSEPLIFSSTNPQYDNRLIIEL